MPFLLDTNVAIHLRAGDTTVMQKASLPALYSCRLSHAWSWRAVSIGSRRTRLFPGRQAPHKFSSGDILSRKKPVKLDL